MSRGILTPKKKLPMESNTWRVLYTNGGSFESQRLVFRRWWEAIRYVPDRSWDPHGLLITRAVQLYMQ